MKQKSKLLISKICLGLSLAVSLSLSCQSFAAKVSLNDVTQAAMKQNLNIKEKMIESHQAKQNLHFNRMSLLPKLNLYNLISSGGIGLGIAGVIDDIAPFLVPANWFRTKESEISVAFQKKSYQALWGNEVHEARAAYLTMVSDLNALKVYEEYQKDLSELQDIAETRDQFGGDRLGALEMLLAQKNKVSEDQITLRDVINQEFYSLSQMTQMDPKSHFEVDLNTAVESSWTFLKPEVLIDSTQHQSPEVSSFEELYLFLGQIRNEIKFSFLGSSSLSKGVAGGVFDDLPLNGGWGFSTQAVFALSKSKEALLRNQQTGVKETLKRQVLRNLDQLQFLTEKENNLNERNAHLAEQWEILLDRLQFGKNAAMEELIANRQAHAETKVALINIKTLRSQINDRAHRMLWWDVYRQYPL